MFENYLEPTEPLNDEDIMANASPYWQKLVNTTLTIDEKYEILKQHGLQKDAQIEGYRKGYITLSPDANNTPDADSGAIIDEQTGKLFDFRAIGINNYDAVDYWKDVYGDESKPKGSWNKQRSQPRMIAELTGKNVKDLTPEDFLNVKNYQHEQWVSALTNPNHQFEKYDRSRKYNGVEFTPETRIPVLYKVNGADYYGRNSVDLISAATGRPVMFDAMQNPYLNATNMPFVKGDKSEQTFDLYRALNTKENQERLKEFVSSEGLQFVEKVNEAKDHTGLDFTSRVDKYIQKYEESTNWFSRLLDRVSFVGKNATKSFEDTTERAARYLTSDNPEKEYLERVAKDKSFDFYDNIINGDIAQKLIYERSQRLQQQTVEKAMEAYDKGRTLDAALGLLNALGQSIMMLPEALSDSAAQMITSGAATAVGTKAGAALGTAVAPGIGTVVGGLLGAIGGLIAGSLVVAADETLASRDNYAENNNGKAMSGADIAKEFGAQFIAAAPEVYLQKLGFTKAFAGTKVGKLMFKDNSFKSMTALERAKHVAGSAIGEGGQEHLQQTISSYFEQDQSKPTKNLWETFKDPEQISAAIAGFSMGGGLAGTSTLLHARSHAKIRSALKEAEKTATTYTPSFREADSTVSDSVLKETEAIKVSASMSGDDKIQAYQKLHQKSLDPNLNIKAVETIQRKKQEIAQALVHDLNTINDVELRRKNQDALFKSLGITREQYFKDAVYHSNYNADALFRQGKIATDEARENARQELLKEAQMLGIPDMQATKLMQQVEYEVSQGPLGFNVYRDRLNSIIDVIDTLEDKDKLKAQNEYKAVVNRLVSLLGNQQAKLADLVAAVEKIANGEARDITVRFRSGYSSFEVRGANVASEKSYNERNGVYAVMDSVEADIDDMEKILSDITERASKAKDSKGNKVFADTKSIIDQYNVGQAMASPDQSRVYYTNDKMKHLLNRFENAVTTIRDDIKKLYKEKRKNKKFEVGSITGKLERVADPKTREDVVLAFTQDVRNYLDEHGKEEILAELDRRFPKSQEKKQRIIDTLNNIDRANTDTQARVDARAKAKEKIYEEVNQALSTYTKDSLESTPVGDRDTLRDNLNKLLDLLRRFKEVSDNSDSDKNTITELYNLIKTGRKHLDGLDKEAAKKSEEDKKETEAKPENKKEELKPEPKPTEAPKTDINTETSGADKTVNNLVRSTDFSKNNLATLKSLVNQAESLTNAQIRKLYDYIYEFMDYVTNQEWFQRLSDKARNTLEDTLEVYASTLAYVAKRIPKANPNDSYTLHSGGAIGSDTVWGDIGAEYGISANHYYHGRKTPNGNKPITDAEFQEGKKRVEQANKTLKRQPSRYIDLLARNWLQVKNADAVFAIGTFTDDGKIIVKGGTGWAVQMAIDSGTRVYVFNQKSSSDDAVGNNLWYRYEPRALKFVPCGTPVLTKNFAGIGTREITDTGKQAIRDVYEKTFGKPETKSETKPVETEPTPTTNTESTLPMDGVRPAFEYKVGAKDGPIAATNKDNKVTIYVTDRNNALLQTVDDFLRYISGKDNTPTSKQKQIVFQRLATKGYDEKFFRDNLKTIQDIYNLILFHEKSHIRHDDRSCYYANGKDLLTKDKIDIETRATEEAIQEFVLMKKQTESKPQGTSTEQPKSKPTPIGDSTVVEKNIARGLDKLNVPFLSIRESIAIYKWFTQHVDKLNDAQRLTVMNSVDDLAKKLDSLAEFQRMNKENQTKVRETLEVYSNTFDYGAIKAPIPKSTEQIKSVETTTTSATTETKTVETHKPTKKPLGTKEHPIEVYSDGSDIKGKGEIGYGAIFVYKGKEYTLSGTNEDEAGKELQARFPDAKFSNPTMELYGTTMVLKAIADLGIGEHIRIIQDYNGVLNWLWDWSEDFVGKHTKTWEAKKPYIAYLQEEAVKAIKQIEANGGSVTLRWVPGHSGDIMNDKADKLARSRESFNHLLEAYEDSETQNTQISESSTATVNDSQTNTPDMTSDTENQVSSENPIQETSPNEKTEVSEETEEPTPEPITSFRGEYDFLSNFYEAMTEDYYEPRRLVYRNAEAAFQAAKFSDFNTRKQFTRLTAAQARAKGRSIKLDEEALKEWNKKKLDVMKNILWSKFTSNKKLADLLLETGDAKLVEGNNWNDTFWGVDNNTGEGANHLGKLLMELREALRIQRDTVTSRSLLNSNKNRFANFSAYLNQTFRLSNEFKVGKADSLIATDPSVYDNEFNSRPDKEQKLPSPRELFDEMQLPINEVDNPYDYMRSMLVDAPQLRLIYSMSVLKDENGKPKLNEKGNNLLNIEFNEITLKAIDFSVKEVMVSKRYGDLFKPFKLPDHRLASLFGLNESTLTYKQLRTIRNIVKNYGVPRAIMADMIGTQVMKNLGIKAKDDDAHSYYYSRTAFGLGMFALRYAEKLGVLERTEYNKPEKADSSYPLDAKHMFCVNIKEKHQAVIDRISETFKDKKDDKGNVLEKGLITQLKPNKDSHVDRGIRWKKPARVPKTMFVRNTDKLLTVPPKAKEVIEKLYNQEYAINRELVDFVRENREAIEKYLGYQTDKQVAELYFSRQIGAEASNETIKEQLQQLLEAVNEYDKLVADGTLKDGDGGIFFEWFMSRNGRFFIDSDGLNPQTNKFQRFVCMPKAVYRTFNYTEEETRLEAFAVAQAFDNVKHSNEDILKIGQAMNALSVEQLEEIRSDIFTLSEDDFKKKWNNLAGEGLGLKGVENLAQCLGVIQHFIAKKNANNGLFKTWLAVENDSTTSGYAIRFANMPREDMHKQMAKTGILMGDELLKYGENDIHELKARDDFDDLYESTAKDIKDDLDDLNPKSEEGEKKIEKRFSEFFTTPNKAMVEFLKDTWTKLYAAMPKASAEKVSSALRTLMKSPTMVFGYSGGIKGISENMAYEVMDEFIQTYLDVKKAKGIEKYLANNPSADRAKVESIIKTFEALEERYIPRDGDTLEQALRTRDLDYIKLNVGKGRMDIEKIFYMLLRPTYGRAVDEALDRNFKEYKQVNDLMNQAFITMFQWFNQLYKDRMKDFKNPTIGQVKKVVESLRDMFPSMPTAYGPSFDDGAMLFLKTAKPKGTNSNIAVSDYTGEMGTNDKGKPTLKSETGYANERSEFTTTAKAGAVGSIHWTDGAIMAAVLAKFVEKGITAIHDAVVASALDHVEITKYMNEVILKTCMDFDIFGTLTNRMLEVTKNYIKRTSENKDLNLDHITDIDTLLAAAKTNPDVARVLDEPLRGFNGEVKTITVDGEKYEIPLKQFLEDLGAMNATNSLARENAYNQKIVVANVDGSGVAYIHYPEDMPVGTAEIQRAVEAIEPKWKSVEAVNEVKQPIAVESKQEQPKKRKVAVQGSLLDMSSQEDTKLTRLTKLADETVADIDSFLDLDDKFGELKKLSGQEKEEYLKKEPAVAELLERSNGDTRKIFDSNHALREKVIDERIPKWLDVLKAIDKSIQNTSSTSRNAKLQDLWNRILHSLNELDTMLSIIDIDEEFYDRIREVDYYNSNYMGYQTNGMILDTLERTVSDVAARAEFVQELHDMAIVDGHKTCSNRHIERLKNTIQMVNPTKIREFVVRLTKDGKLPKGPYNAGHLEVKDGKFTVRLAQDDRTDQVDPITRQSVYSGMSMAETYSHEVIHAGLHFAFTEHLNNRIKFNKEIRQLLELQKAAIGVITVEDFMPEDYDPSMESLHREHAQRTYDYIFNNPHKETLEGLKEFCAYGLTHERIVNKLASVKTPEKNIKFNNLADRLLYVVKGIFDIVFKGESLGNVFPLTSALISGTVTIKGGTIYDDLAQLTYKMSNADAKAARSLMSQAMKPVEHLFKLTNDLRLWGNKHLGAGVRWATTIGDRWNRTSTLNRRLGTSRWNDAAIVAKSLATLLVSANSRKVVKQVMTDIFQASQQGAIMSILNDITAPDMQSMRLQFLSMINRTIDNDAKSAEAISYKEISEKFGKKKLTELQESSLTYVGLFTDLQCLIDDNMTLDDVLNLVSNDTARHAQIEAFENTLKSNQNYNWLVTQARGLGLFMATGIGHAGQNLNAYNIARGILFDGTLHCTSDEEVLIDKLATLYALDLINPDHRRVFASLNKEGLDYFLSSHKAFVKNSKDGVSLDTGEISRTILNTHIIKGYTKALFDTSYDMQPGFITQRKKFEDMGYEVVKMLPKNRITGTKNMALFRRNFANPARRDGAAVKIVGAHAMGTTLRQSAYTIASALDNNQYKPDDMWEVFMKEADSASQEVQRASRQRPLTIEELKEFSSGYTPIISPKTGEAVDYRITMSVEDKVNLLGMDTRGITILSKMFASQEMKAKAPAVNKAVTDFLVANMENNMTANHRDITNNVKYTKITRYSDNKYLRESWNVIPKEIKDKAEELEEDNGDGLWVREDWLHDLFGVENYSITQSMPKDSWTRTKRIIAIAEYVMKTLTYVAKRNIVLFIPQVLIGNIASNYAFNIMNGTNPIKSLSYTLANFRAIRDYMDTKKQLERIKFREKIGKATQTEINSKNTLETILERNRVHPLMKKGMYQAVVEDMNPDELENVGKVIKLIKNWKVAEKVPAPLKWLVKNLYMAEGTFLYNFMFTLTQYSDFVARATEYQSKLEDIEKDTPKFLSNGRENPDWRDKEEQLSADIVREFINYDKPQSKGEQYLNDMGLLFFTKFAKRIQSVITDQITKNPMGVLMFLACQCTFLDVENIMEQHWLVKHWSALPHNPVTNFMSAVIPPYLHAYYGIR